METGKFVLHAAAVGLAVIAVGCAQNQNTADHFKPRSYQTGSNIPRAPAYVNDGSNDTSNVGSTLSTMNRQSSTAIGGRGGLTGEGAR